MFFNNELFCLNMFSYLMSFIASEQPVILYCYLLCLMELIMNLICNVVQDT